ncbi:hypothetical protein D9756_007181 [Leucocoprinus leucothites]|uniref:Glutamine amidotransferase domain-containing protein n=1 Tax=Leucocoprinus leucothites TaxID=201217 RepID=A0A8H5D5M9_9AGAR|nr:hypothetical protein D9756_007181 [Leucoagaricus leucothites]
MAPPRIVRIGILICGSLTGAVKEVNGDYPEVYTRYWKDTAPPNVRLIVDCFDVKNNEFPEERRLDTYDMFMVTGSVTSAYDDDIPWVKKLVLFLRGLINDHPKVRVTGICFGHQAVNRALGGGCEPAGTWEVGPTTIHLSDVGRSIFGVDQLCLQEIHSDHVPLESLFKNFASGELRLVGSTGPTINQGVVKFYPSSSGDVVRSPRDIHVLTLQGHPEFTESIITGMVRQNINNFGPVLNDYWGPKGGDYDGEPADKEGTGRRWSKCDGDVVGQVYWKMLGVIPSVDHYGKPQGKEGVSVESPNMRALSSYIKVESEGQWPSSSRGWRWTDGFRYVTSLFWSMLGMASRW